MWILRFMLPLVLCLTQVDCTETPAEKALLDSVHAHAHVGRGGPRNGHDFVVYPEVLAKWVHEIPEIAKGTPADEVIRRLGEPDYAYENAPELSLDSHADYMALYCIIMDRNDLDKKYEPLSSTSILNGTESIHLVFDSNGRYKSYFIEYPPRPRKNDAPLNAPSDQDLAGLLRAGPAATTQ